MKDRITITLDPEVVHHGKRVARARKTTLSGLIESLLREQTLPAARQPREGSFSTRWRGKLTARDDPSDELLRAMRTKHAVGADENPD